MVGSMALPAMTAGHAGSRDRKAFANAITFRPPAVVVHLEKLLGDFTDSPPRGLVTSHFGKFLQEPGAASLWLRRGRGLFL